MTHFTDLNSPVNVRLFRDDARANLISLLDSVPGKKNLVLDPTLTGTLNLIAEYSLLKEHGVENIYLFKPGHLAFDNQPTIYICRPRSEYMRYIAEQIHSSQESTSSSSSIDCTILFVPRKSLICQGILEEEGVLGDIRIAEFPLYLIPMESDFLSMELQDSFGELYINGQMTSLFYAAKALMMIQDKFGMFPYIIGKGDRAKELSNLMLRMRREMAIQDPIKAASFGLFSRFDAVIIIDRTVDMISPLCTQLTYEGLIDEVFGIKNCQVEIDANLVDGNASTPGTTSTKKKKQLLDSKDPLFQQMRDTNFTVIGQFLNKIARRLNQDFEGRHAAKTIPEIKQFVSKLADLQTEQKSLRLHTGIAEQIMQFTTSEEFNKILEIQQNYLAGLDVTQQHGLIEELIDRQQPIEAVLRLLCLESLMSGGLKQKNYEFFKKEILQTYGYEHVKTFYVLEQLGLFTKQASSQGSSKIVRDFYTHIRRPLQLIVDDVNEHEPNDISYVYSGYAPLSVRLIQCVIQKSVFGRTGISPSLGWKGFEDIVRILPGATFVEHQKPTHPNGKRRTTLLGEKPKPVLVFYLGGITYAEIAALRFMSRNDPTGHEIVIASTQILNGNSMIRSIIGKPNHV